MLARHLLALSGVVCALVVDVASQGSRNVAMLANWNPNSRGSDVWGYVDPGTGREYALLGTMSGLYVVNCTDPRNPYPTGLIPTDSPGSSGNRWQDMKVFGSYAYNVSEAYGGVQVIDLTDPENPRKVKTWGASMWSSAHNIAMDFDAGVAYVCGTNNGTHVIDVGSNPTNPTRLHQLNNPASHDMAIQDGLAHLADIGANRYYIFDVAALPSMPQVSSTRSAGRSSCHSMWPSRDNQIAAVCHETSGGELVIYDISVPRLPRFLSKFQTGGSSAILHNPVVRDRVCHISWNTEGYQAMDLSDPANPVRVGYWDTWPGSSSGFNGMWGVFAVQPSGIIYGNDRDLGLFVFNPKCTVRHYGNATPGNATPALHTFGSAYRGNTRFRLDVAEAAPGRAGVIVLGAAPAAINAGGLEILIDLTRPYALLPVAIDAEGEGPAALPIPGAIGDARLYAQAFVLDPAAPLGVSASRAIEFEAFGL